MAKLSEKQADLFRGKNWGTVVTLREDGSPHATPVWIDTDGEHVLFNTAVGRAKERGTAELTEDGAVEHIDKLAKNYLGQDKYPYLEPGGQRVVVKITLDKVDSMGVE